MYLFVYDVGVHRHICTVPMIDDSCNIMMVSMIRRSFLLMLGAALLRNVV